MYVVGSTDDVLGDEDEEEEEEEDVVYGWRRLDVPS